MPGGQLVYYKVEATFLYVHEYLIEFSMDLQFSLVDWLGLRVGLNVHYVLEK